MWIETLAKFGYVAKGIVYGLIGVLAVMAALTVGGKTTDAKGALQTIAQQPFGQLILVLLAIGLVGYALWRFVQAVKDPEHGTDAKGIVTRFGHVLSGLIYGGLAVNAALLIIGSGTSGSGNTKQDWTAFVLQQPFGRWLVGVVGALIIGWGFYELYKAYKVKFRKRLNLSELSRQQQNWLIGICRFGVAARGVVFIMIGFFVIQAARQSDASEVRGLDGALQSLAAQPYGQFLLAIVALGLIGYGVYMLVQARYRRFNTESMRFSHN